ncbi:tetratricopeptide repeat protein [Aurantibacillus circumpalustris]|uniref:tetratricopeptide repeat protein n=1 Tax=Aurantibacillus circumpalustris TaxID=3036359 RepID=UPI00295A6A9F|nr:tetratricopeptide repeat protein [Aurantibacillus circumpalustris]
MKKIEIIVFGIVLLFYLNNIFGFEIESGVYALVHFLAFLYISFLGYQLYIPDEYTNKVKSTFFAIFCGVAFASGIMGFTLKIFNMPNAILLLLNAPNLVLFFLLIHLLRRNRKNALIEKVKYYKGLIIRCSVIITLSVIILFLPLDFINIYLNRNIPTLHSRGLAQKNYKLAMQLSENKEYEQSLVFSQKAIEFYEIGYDTTYFDGFIAQYRAYWGLIEKNIYEGSDDKVLENIYAIQRPLRILYGDSSQENAYLKTLLGELYVRAEKYNKADSLFIEALNLYENHFKTKNIYYALTLKLLANSYREQYYYQQAIKVYQSAVIILTSGSKNYNSLQFKDQPEDIIINTLAGVYADIGWTYSKRQIYDSADAYFEKAFDTKTYSQSHDYSISLTNYAFHVLNKGDFRKAKALMEQSLNRVFKINGENTYYYLNVLNGLNIVNIALADYKEAEQGCNKSIKILEKITSSKDNFYGSLLLRLGLVKHYQGFYETAENLFNEALSYTNNTTIQYADILDALSSLKCDLTQYQAALDQAQMAKKIAIIYFEEKNNPYLTQYIRSEAYINYLIENTNESEKLYEQCLSIDTTNKMEDKISFGSTLNGIGLIKSRKNRFIEADTLFNRTMRIYEMQIGKNHPDYATVLYNKAYLRLKEGKLSESENLFQQALEIINKTLDSQHDKIADNLTGLGEIRLKEKRKNEALKYFTQANEIYKAKFKSDHKKVILTSKYISLSK